MDELTEISIVPDKLIAARGPLPLTHVAKTIGISKQRLWNYENGRADMPSNVLVRLCLLYKIPVEKLTNLDKKMYTRS